MERVGARQTSGSETLAQFLQERARRFTTRTALLFKPGFRYQRWTYAQLWEGAGQVASLLQRRGLKKGDRVVLWAPNCPQWVVVFFGCMRAGAIAVPLDLRTAPDFVERVTSRTRPALAFVSRVTPEAHRQLEMPKVYLEELEELIRNLPPPQEVQLSGADLAEVMFTSGTTGDPKGVMLTHGNLIANMEAASLYIPGKPSHRLLSILPLSHMFEQTGGLLIPLRCGASITYPTSHQPAVLLRTIRERKVTTLLVVPQVLELFMKGVEREVTRQGKKKMWRLMLRIAKYTPFRLRRLLCGQVHKRFGGCLDFIVSAGAALDPKLGVKWALLGVKVIQGYGATEASPVISVHTLRRPRFDSVGRPLPGVEVRISEEGEVLVRGPNITPGYWEAPEQTAAAFQDGWYKTGDLGFIDDQDFLHLRGRKKDMIVLPTGQNVFPEDIEVVLNKHPAVTDAVVVGLPKGTGVEVHAVLLLEDPAAAREVVSWTNKQLADHQRIRGFTVWTEEDLPRTHTLKVKKGVVLEMLMGVKPSASAAAAAAKATHVEIAHDVEGLVAEIGGLSPEQVTPERTLGTDLEMDSLKRVELLSAVEEELGVYLDESQVGPDTTVEQLKEMVEAGGRGASPPPFPRWGMSLWCRMLRGVLQRTFIFPLAAVTYRLRVTGREKLHDLQGTVLFVANHNLHLDNPLIIKAMPLRWRRRLAIAAFSELWQSRFWAVVNPLLGNGFPFSKEGAIRASLDNLGRVLDGGWSVLIYPEGELTIGGPMQPFKSGIGLLAVEGRLPVVPLRLHIHRMGSPWQLPFLQRGHVEIRFGKPVTFSPGTSYLDATRAIEEGVNAL